MTDKNVDSDQKPDGTQGQPNPDVSPVSGDEQNSQVLEVLKGLTGRLEAIEKQQRALQGDKDRGVARNQSDIRKVLEEVEALKKSGLSQDQAVNQLELQDTLRTMQSQLASLQSPTGTEGQQSGSLAQAVEEAGLRPDDPDVAELLSRNASEVDVWKLAAKKASNPKPTPAQEPSSVSKAVGSVDEDALSAEYVTLSGNPTQNHVRLSEIEKLLGWN